MGTTARVLVLADTAEVAAALGATAAARLADLEARWSRFLPESELSRLNASSGHPVVVSRETFALVARAVDAWRRTCGWFDPTGLAAIHALGYDRDFDEIGEDLPAATTYPFPGAGAIDLDPIVGAVVLPADVALDLGGIGKGYAGDLVAQELREAGAHGVALDVGGDVRVCGTGPEAGDWRVHLAAPEVATRFGAVRLGGGAVTTSTTRRRRWTRAGLPVHHLLDPTTGRPAARGVETVIVVGGEAWWSEVLAKAALIAGPDAGLALLETEAVEGALVLERGEVVTTRGFAAWCSGPEQVLAGGEAAEVGEVQERGDGVEHGAEVPLHQLAVTPGAVEEHRVGDVLG